MKKKMLVKFVDGSSTKIDRRHYDNWRKNCKVLVPFQFFNDGLINLNNVCLIEDIEWWQFWK